MTMTIWIIVAVVGVVSIGLKTAGPVLIGGRELPPVFRRTVAYLTPAVLAALIATQIFASGRDLGIDARGIGLLAGATALFLRAPALAAVVVAAVATAVVRAV